MSDFNPAKILVDYTGSYIGVPSGIYSGTTGNPLVISFNGPQFITSSIPLVITGSVLAFPTGTQTVNGTVTAIITGTLQTSLTGTSVITGSVGITNFPSVQTVTGSSSVQGFASSGSNINGNPILYAGVDVNGKARIPFIDTDGIQFVQEKNEATFIAWVTGSAIGSNKSMMSILNATGSNSIIKIREIWLTNVQTSAVAGITGIFEFRRMYGHSAGTQISSGSIETMDTIDVINSNVTIRTGATITNESTVLLWKSKWSTDEWGPGSLDVEGSDHSVTQMFPVYSRKDDNEKPITLRAGNGLTIKHTPSSTAGSFDIAVIFTQVN